MERSRLGGESSSTAFPLWSRKVTCAEAGEKVTGSPFVFNQKLRFGSYNPSGVISECLPPGEGRLNEINPVPVLRSLGEGGRIANMYWGVRRTFQPRFDHPAHQRSSRRRPPLWSLLEQ